MLQVPCVTRISIDLVALSMKSMHPLTVSPSMILYLTDTFKIAILFHLSTYTKGKKSTKDARQTQHSLLSTKIKSIIILEGRVSNSA